VATLIAAEVFARFALGLGDPPLFQKDDAIEYVLKPGTYRRFGHTIHINRWSQRSPEIEAKKSDPNEFRVLVIGDSVVNGGALLDDTEIATTLLERALTTQLNRPVRVLNISAGSWGPANQLAYLEKVGTFDADAAVIVWSSHDASDVPRFDGLRDDQPEQRPMLAVGELITRYALPRLRRSPTATPAPSENAFDQAMQSAIDLIAFARSRNLPIAIVLHETRGEIEGKSDTDHSLDRGRRLLKDMVTATAIPLSYTRTHFAPALAKGDTVFQDDIHPAAQGQKLLAQCLEQAMRPLLESQTPKSP
jgi:lysophospholipase L1-like esterase